MNGKGWAVGSRGDRTWGDTRAASYRDAGVDRDAGAEAVARIATAARPTFGVNVLSDIGGFGGLFSLPNDVRHDADSVLVASSDGVGTKTLLCTATSRFDTIGLDLVAMNVDDIVVYGARPLFLLDYLVVGSVLPEMVESIVAGVAEGCRQARCALLGGEVAEHPGTMAGGEFDMAGFVVGAVSRSRIVTGESIATDDVVIGLGAAGMRSDGYSLVRRIFADRDLDGPAYPGADISLGEELTRPSAIYAPLVLDLMASLPVHGAAHVTGGGIAANIARVLPPTLDVRLEVGAWPIPPIFTEMARYGGVPLATLADALPIGIGMALMLPREHEAEAIARAHSAGFEAYTIGDVRAGTGVAGYDGF